MSSPDVLVSVVGVCLRAEDSSPTVQTLEEYMSLTPLLTAVTLNEAIAYFLSNTDTVAEIQEVHSFKVDGHEFLHTFLT